MKKHSKAVKTICNAEEVSIAVPYDDNASIELVVTDEELTIARYDADDNCTSSVVLDRYETKLLRLLVNRPESKKILGEQ